MGVSVTDRRLALGGGGWTVVVGENCLHYCCCCCCVFLDTCVEAQSTILRCYSTNPNLFFYERRSQQTDDVLRVLDNGVSVSRFPLKDTPRLSAVKVGNQIPKRFT